MNQPSNCRVCKSRSVTLFLRRKGVPVHQNLVMMDERSALEMPRGKFDLAVCEDCGFVFNQAFEPLMLKYGEDYDNTQSYSPAFEEYLCDLARHLVFQKGVQNCRIVEIGCGKGLFLRKLIEMGQGNTGYGFDPSYVGPTTALEGRLHFEKRFYDLTCVNIPADVIICRHVIEHIADPLVLLHTIKRALASSPQTKVFFETPTVQWILQNQVFWDFCYEHCSYFSAASLKTAFEATGFKVKNIEEVFGDQCLWLEATLFMPGEKPLVTKNPDCIPSLARQFAESEEGLKNRWNFRIQELASKGKIALWGAGAKGVTFANLIDPERRGISCVVDLNPHKQGRYLPGTAHPIVDYRDLPRYGVGTAILMNPNYYDENVKLLRQAQINVHLVNLMELQRDRHG